MQFSFSINHTSLCYSNLKFFSSSEALSLISDHLSRSTQAMLFPSFILKSHITQLSHSATQLSKYFLSHSEALNWVSNHFSSSSGQCPIMILSLSFAVLKHKLSLLLFILPGQGNITKVFAIWSFPNSCYIQPELRTILLNFLKHCCSASWVRVTLVQQMPRILGCHLILRNIKSIIMFHLLWDIYLCFDQITKNIWNTKTHICGGKTWGREIINSLRTLVISLPIWVL